MSRWDSPASSIRTGLQIFFLTLPPSAAAVARVVPLDFDYRVFAFTLVTSGLTTIMFALVPALQATRGTLTGALRGETAGLRASTLRNVLVVGQVTASLVLIVLATTLVRNAVALKDTDVGFETSALFSIRQRAAGAGLITRAHDALAGDGRFSAIALTSRNPLFGEQPRTFIRTTPASGSPSSGGPDRRRDGVATTYMHVSPEYFAALGVTIVQGRGFDAGEARAESHVAVISASAAQALWPGGNALGQTFRMWLPPEVPADAITRSDLFSTKDVEEKSFDVVVIGVAADIANEMVYHGRHVPHLYMPTARAGSQARALLVRGRSAADVREAVQAILRDVDPNPLAFEALPVEEAIALQMYPLTVASWIGMLLSAVALALSVSGLYGVMTYGISHRMKEIGIRMALGASSRSIVRLVLSQSSRLVTIGAGHRHHPVVLGARPHARNDRPEERVDSRPGGVHGRDGHSSACRRRRGLPAVAESDARRALEGAAGGVRLDLGSIEDTGATNIREVSNEGSVQTGCELWSLRYSVVQCPFLRSGTSHTPAARERYGVPGSLTPAPAISVHPATEKTSRLAATTGVAPITRP